MGIKDKSGSEHMIADNLPAEQLERSSLPLRNRCFGTDIDSNALNQMNESKY